MNIVENRNKLDSWSLNSKALDSEYAVEFQREPITSRELRLRNSLHKLLETLSKLGEANGSTLRKDSGLHTNTMSRIIPILKERQIIKETRFRAHFNQKFYSIHYSRAMVFLSLLFAKERFEHFLRINQESHKKLTELNEGKSLMPSLRIKERKLIASFKIYVPIDLQKEYGLRTTKKVSISELPHKLADKIIMNCFCERYCFDCFHEGMLCLVKRFDNGSHCQNCGHNCYDIDLRSKFSARKIPSVLQ